jgi:hypothetical protein
MIRPSLLALLIAASPLALAPLATPARAHGPTAATSASAAAEKFEADRAAILAMAGNYKVRFDFEETTAWDPGYTLHKAKPSGGHEVVRVIEDSGRTISLQHLLVAEQDGKSFVIKHWRQDWTYEPNDVLVYKGKDQWVMESVPEKMRRGRWSQTVWQTDDSPRYGGWGEFSSEGGVPRWRSNWTLRPLARRDAVRKPAYDHYLAINRHQPTPGGWIHWQDNMKMAEDKAIVQEAGLNSYEKFDSFDAARADRYWSATKDYWAAVRAAWSEVARRDKGIHIEEQAEWGSVTSEKLMTWADDIEKGTMTTEAAAREARALILTSTAPKIASR